MTAVHLVELYGLAVSSPVPLPAWPLVTGARVDVVVRFGALPEGADTWDDGRDAARIFSSDVAAGEAPSLVVHRFEHARFLRLAYAEGIRFHVALDGSEVWADWDAPLTEADAVTFLLGPVMGVVLRQRGVLVLHASAIAIDGRAWGFVGPGGAGKSTLAAAFASRGVPVLTEDVLALRPDVAGHWCAAPGYGEIRLWDESVALVAEDPATLPPLTPTWPKRCLDLRAHAMPFARGAVPLGGLFVLQALQEESERPECVPIAAGEGLLDLVGNAYVSYVASAAGQGSDLVALAAIVRRVPLWRLQSGAGREGIDRTIVRITAVLDACAVSARDTAT